MIATQQHGEGNGQRANDNALCTCTPHLLLNSNHHHNMLTRHTANPDRRSGGTTTKMGLNLAFLCTVHDFPWNLSQRTCQVSRFRRPLIAVRPAASAFASAASVGPSGLHSGSLLTSHLDTASRLQTTSSSFRNLALLLSSIVFTSFGINFGIAFSFPLAWDNAELFLFFSCLLFITLPYLVRLPSSISGTSSSCFLNPKPSTLNPQP